MAIRSGFFNSVNGDRKYNAGFFAEYFASLVGNGVFPEPSTGLQVMSSNDMTVSVKEGKCLIDGYFGTNDDDYILEIDPADGVLNRIDRVVLRWDAADREIRIEVKNGTFASSPVAPSLQRDADAYELGIADIAVNAGAVSITQPNITDLRLNSELCGKVDSLIAGDYINLRNAIDIIEGNIEDLENNKVDKVTGKGLSTNDYTTTEKNKLSGIAAGAQVNTVTSVNGKTGAVSLVGPDVGLALATAAEAIAGTDNTKVMTSFRTRESIATAPSMANLSAATYVQLTASGNWTKPAAAKQVYVEMWGAGGGGNFGYRYGSDKVSGGTAGNGGDFISYLFNASDLPATVPYIIGAGGVGGKYAGSIYATPGGDTVFASTTHKLTAFGSIKTNKSISGFEFEEGGLAGNAAATYSTEDAYNTSRAGTAGGGGGARASDGSAIVPGVGGVPRLFSTLTNATSGANGGAPTSTRSCGGGGAGGASASSGTAGKGGDGGIACGGGGGGALRGTGSGGDGGNGGNGIIRLWWW